MGNLYHETELKSFSDQRFKVVLQFRNAIVGIILLLAGLYTVAPNTLILMSISACMTGLAVLVISYLRISANLESQSRNNQMASLEIQKERDFIDIQQTNASLIILEQEIDILRWNAEFPPQNKVNSNHSFGNNYC